MLTCPIARWSECGRHGAGKQFVIVQEERMVAEDDGQWGAMVSSEHRTGVPAPNHLGGDEVTSEGGGGTAPFPLGHVHLCRPPDAASTEEGGAIKVRGQDGNIW